MALDRQSIARRDFPTRPAGYDPAAVDAHLAALADEVEELRRRVQPAGAVATQTSEQVRTILEAAEASAARIRAGATADAQQHVARVAEAADGLRERVDALERDLTGLLAGLRAGAERLRRDLDAVAAGAAGLVATAPASDAPVGIAPSARGATLSAAADPVEEEVGEEPALAAVEEPPAGAGARSGDVEGARIVAFERAISGRPRDETDRYLAEHYDLPDRAALLDEAYAVAPRD